MSRFGVLSLLLALGLELGTSLTPGCQDPFCKLTQIDDGSEFRDSSSSDSLLRALIGPLVAGPELEGTSLRKLRSEGHDDANDFGTTSLTEEDQGFRYSFPDPFEEFTTGSDGLDLVLRFLTQFRGMGLSDRNVFCKYIKVFLRRAVEVIRPFFG